jgi:hypothetical protein
LSNEYGYCVRVINCGDGVTGAVDGGGLYGLVVGGGLFVDGARVFGEVVDVLLFVEVDIAEGEEPGDVGEGVESFVVVRLVGGFAEGALIVPASCWLGEIFLNAL